MADAALSWAGLAPSLKLAFSFGVVGVFGVAGSNVEVFEVGGSNVEVFGVGGTTPTSTELTPPSVAIGFGLGGAIPSPTIFGLGGITLADATLPCVTIFGVDGANLTTVASAGPRPTALLIADLVLFQGGSPAVQIVSLLITAA